MSQVIAISLTKKIKKDIDALSVREGISRSDLIRRAIKEYLFAHQFRALRNQMVSKTKIRGIYTDQDVFDRVS